MLPAVADANLIVESESRDGESKIRIMKDKKNEKEERQRLIKEVFLLLLSEAVKSCFVYWFYSTLGAVLELFRYAKFCWF